MCVNVVRGDSATIAKCFELVDGFSVSLVFAIKKVIRQIPRLLIGVEAI